MLTSFLFKGIAIGDSLLRPVVTELQHRSDIRVLFKPGATLRTFHSDFFSVEKISPQLWQKVEIIWILVGTNDIDNGQKRKEGFKLGKFAEEYRDLLLSIQAHLRAIHITCCAVVPRLVDYDETKSIINVVNKKIRKMCNQVNAT